MVLLKVSLLLFVFGSIHGLNIRAALTTLDAFNTQSFDREVRKHMVELVTQRASALKTQQDTAENTCAVTINTTIDHCNACAQSKCGQTQSGGGNIWKFLGSQITNVVVDKFPDVISSGAQKVLDGINSLGGSIGSGVHTGVDTIKHGAETALHGLTHTATDIGNQIKHGAETVGNTIKDAAGSVVHSIGHLFGKRLDACVSACPDCVKMDTDSKSSEQILTDVCGAGYMTQKNQRTADATKLQTFYNAAAGHTVISKVEYDPTSIDVTQGVAFKTVFITANLNGTPRRYQSDVMMKLTDLPAWATELSQELHGMM